jgi:hypothetical protein
MVPASNFGGSDERTDIEVGLNYVRGHEVKFQIAYDLSATGPRRTP